MFIVKTKRGKEIFIEGDSFVEVGNSIILYQNLKKPAF